VGRVGGGGGGRDYKTQTVKADFSITAVSDLGGLAIASGEEFGDGLVSTRLDVEDIAEDIVRSRIGLARLVRWR